MIVRQSLSAMDVKNGGLDVSWQEIGASNGLYVSERREHGEVNIGDGM